MTRPLFITFTGIDARTDLARCEALSARYPIEWGVLFGGKPGKNRYPEEAVVLGALGANLRLSAHLCKDVAVLANGGGGFPLAQSFTRMQVNLEAGQYDPDTLARLAASTGTRVILQHRAMDFPAPIECLDYLQDLSGGRGVLPSYWARPHDPEQLVGYAGGLNPENVADAVRHMPAERLWIDMETGIRKEDWLDLDKCEAVCRAVYPDL